MNKNLGVTASPPGHSAEPEPAKAVSAANAASVPNAKRKWKKAEFDMLVSWGRDTIKRVRVAGLSDGVFGLDRRGCWDFGDRRTGYVVTHLKTGYAVRHLACNLPDAKRAVALLHKTSWDFDKPEDAATPARMETVRAVNALGFAANGSDFDPASGIEAPSGGETALAGSTEGKSPAPEGGDARPGQPS